VTDVEKIMNGRFSDPAPLGLAGFAFTTWMLSMINAGWFSADGMGDVLALAFAYGGTAQIIAGVLEYPRGNTFGTTAFISYGSFWWSFALFIAFFASRVPEGFLGWYLFVWGVFTFYMWIGSLRTSRALQTVLLALWITYLLLAVGDWSHVTVITRIGGYTGLITAVAAFYASAAVIINDSFGHTVLPVGEYAHA
jgi:succinate-acetate transporter protein